MGLKIKSRLFSLLALALIGLLIAIGGIDPVVARVPQLKQIVASNNPNSLEQQGKQLYTTGHLAEAIALWQQATTMYAQQKKIISQARVLTNLALAYQQLGNLKQAQSSIDQSFSLLQSQTVEQEDSVRAQVLAQALNTQGIVQLSQGETENAAATWQKAAEVYQQLGDKEGVIRASINLANAFKSLGFYRRAYKVLAQIEQDLRQQPDSLLKVAALRNYGDILRLVGELAQARTTLTESLAIASKSGSSEDEAKVLFTLGNTWWANNSDRQAVKAYQKALAICRTNRTCASTNLSLQINLALLRLFLDTDNWQKAENLLPKIQSSLTKLSPSRANIYKQISFAHSLLKLKHKSQQKQVTLKLVPSWQEIEVLLTDAIQQVESPEDIRAKSYLIGLQGQVYEQQEKWSTAQRLTQQALILSQSINAPEISYLWQWQLGRIFQAEGNRHKAISAYAEAVELLQSLSQDLAVINLNLQYSFRDSVELVYRELVNLLLKSSLSVEISAENLEQARDVIESLQLAELNNFFREACLETQPVQIDRIDQQTAVIYPIILRDRLEIILSLPQQPLRHYSTAVRQAELETAIEQFLQTIVVRSRRQFYEPAQQLYDWLIRPVLSDLVDQNIKTIIFVPDGSLRNIPLSALHDGEHYLIEQYSVAITPGLQLLAPRALKQIELKTLAAGLTKKRPGFSSLNYVDRELAVIQDQISSTVMLNEDFTQEAFRKQVEISEFPVVHIATHGQFSSTLDQTFILAWDSRINIDELDSILQTRTLGQDEAIELLVLSACETAAGDDRAALGLAGIAVRAGARSTFATLWAVNDRSTAKLMSTFYQELTKKNTTKAQAVQQAQLTLLQSPEYKHPFYWAAYVLLGNWL